MQFTKHKSLTYSQFINARRAVIIYEGTAMSAASMHSISTACGRGFVLSVNPLSSEKPLSLRAPKTYGQDQAWKAMKRHRSKHL